jgi:hypothetical protein
MQLVIAGTNFDNTKEFEMAARARVVLGRVRSLPGVQSAGVTSALPLSWHGGTNTFTPEGIKLDSNVTHDAIDRVVTPGYFETMGIPFKKGRLLNDREEHFVNKRYKRRICFSGRKVPLA